MGNRKTAVEGTGINAGNGLSAVAETEFISDKKDRKYIRRLANNTVSTFEKKLQYTSFNGISEKSNRFDLIKKDSSISPVFVNFRGMFLAIYQNQLHGIIRHKEDNVFDFWGNSLVLTQDSLPWIITRGKKYFTNFLLQNGVEKNPYILNNGNDEDYIAPQNDIVDAILFLAGTDSSFDVESIPA